MSRGLGGKHLNYNQLAPNGMAKQSRLSSVSGDELVGFINGKINLPARSIVLTFDLGDNPNSVERMLEVFQRYNIHGIFTIYSMGMGPENPSSNCLNDACWKEINKAYTSGLATIGSHTLKHRDFAKLSKDVGLEQLLESKNLIETMVGDGCKVNILTWPFESCPEWAKEIKNIGYEAAFGGYSRPILENGIHPNDDFWFKLPRVLPPNTDGYSGRPGLKKLPEIAKMYTSPALDRMDLFQAP